MIEKTHLEVRTDVAAGATQADGMALCLLGDFVGELKKAISSLSGRVTDESADLYVFDVVKSMVPWIEGYLALRKLGNVEAARLCIRPMLEAVFKACAARANPSLFFRIAYTEHHEDRKFVRCAERATKDSDLAAVCGLWEQFRKAYQAKYPGRETVEKTISTAELAKAGGLESHYDAQFRYYSQFTHVSYRAVSGGFDEVKPGDLVAVCFCAYLCLGVVRDLGATVPALDNLARRLSKVSGGG